MENFGQVIQRIRKNIGMTQKELSEISGISYSYLTKLEIGENANPSLDTIEKIIKALGVKLYFVRDVGNVNKYAQLSGKSKAAVDNVINFEYNWMMAKEKIEKEENEDA